MRFRLLPRVVKLFPLGLKGSLSLIKTVPAGVELFRFHIRAMLRFPQFCPSFVQLGALGFEGGGAFLQLGLLLLIRFPPRFKLVALAVDLLLPLVQLAMAGAELLLLAA